MGNQVKRLSFDDLPYEIRDMIFNYAIKEVEPTHPPYGVKEVESSHPPYGIKSLRYVEELTTALRPLPFSYSHILKWRYSVDRFLLNYRNAFNIEICGHSSFLRYSPRAMLSITTVHVEIL